MREFLGSPPDADAETPAPFVPVRVTAGELRDQVEDFAALLVDAVASGASVGFHGPLAPARAVSFWQGLAAGVAAGRVDLWAVYDHDAKVCGAVQVHRPDSPNAAHRAEIAKLLVRRDVRRKGLARMLLRTAEASAWGDGVRLLILDTQTGSAADHFYRAAGWTPFGTVPGYAADPDGALLPTTFFFKSLPDEAI
ncbi:GNAT family N-acetyltransferase [Actinacidiphila rubida]|uniref:GNAT family N-acetyltransferase n=1 Tax=Actinacidiphila rubida TaxID=310780 RepID=UPI003898EB87